MQDMKLEFLVGEQGGLDRVLLGCACQGLGSNGPTGKPVPIVFLQELSLVIFACLFVVF